LPLCRAYPVNEQKWYLHADALSLSSSGSAALGTQLAAWMLSIAAVVVDSLLRLMFDGGWRLAAAEASTNRQCREAPRSRLAGSERRLRPRWQHCCSIKYHVRAPGKSKHACRTLTAAAAALLAAVCLAAALPPAQAATYVTSTNKPPWQLAASITYAAKTHNNTAVYAPHLEFEVSFFNAILISNNTLWGPNTTQPYYYFYNSTGPANVLTSYEFLFSP